MPFYKLSKDGGLVLIIPERRLLELNLSAVEIAIVVIPNLDELK